MHNPESLLKDHFLGEKDAWQGQVAGGLVWSRAPKPILW